MGISKTHELCGTCDSYTNRRLIWNIITKVWKIIFLSKLVICRFHVNLPGCTFFFAFFGWNCAWIQGFLERLSQTTCH